MLMKVKYQFLNNHKLILFNIQDTVDAFHWMAKEYTCILVYLVSYFSLNILEL